MNLIILGLIFDLVGVSILVIITIFNQSHQTTYPDTPKKRYITYRQQRIWENTFSSSVLKEK